MAKLRMLGARVQRVDTRSAPPQPKKAEPIYNTPRWRKLVASLIKLRGKRCEQCGRTGTRIYADHIIELRDGGEPFDDGNIELLCGSCHTIKTNREKARRAERG